MRVVIFLAPLLALSACGKQSSGNEQPPVGNAMAEAAPSQAPLAHGNEVIEEEGRTAELDVSHRGQPMPADGFYTADKKPVTLAALKGQPLLVNLWATWCGPCVIEMPSLDDMAAHTTGKLKVIAVSQDSPQAVDPVPAWWAKANFQHLALYRDPDTNLGTAYAGGQLPQTILYDAAGKEVWRITGSVIWTGKRAGELLAAYRG